MVYFLRGVAALASLPALVLVAAQIGFAALARDAGFTMWQAVYITIVVWALPSQVVFVGSLASGASLVGAMVAVALASVRFMPMVMSWMPLVRTPRVPRWSLLLLSWFVAVTAWVFAMTRLPDLPRHGRAAYFAGFAAGLTLASATAVGVAFALVGELPPVVGALLVFLTPVYFLTSLWGAARAHADRIALAAGLLLGPVFSVLVPGADLLLAGLVGGTLAYLAGRVIAGGRPA